MSTVPAMFASLAFIAALAQVITIPLQPTPRQLEPPKAPIEIAGKAFDAACEDFDQWDKPAPPVRIHANTYLVGTCGISAILVAGSQGHVLIDAGTDAGAGVVAENIRSLGFNLRDVKYLLHSHEHVDHVGGIARLQRLTGAQLIASPAAAAVFRTGTFGEGDPQAGMHPPFPVARVDRLVTDGQTVRLGELMFTAIATPGHTPGALSWHWGACDGGVCRRIVYVDSLNPISRDGYRFSDHPAYVAAFRAGIAKVAAVECDILVTPHPSSSDMITRMAGRAPLENRSACRDYAATMGKRLDDRLATEKKK